MATALFGVLRSMSARARRSGFSVLGSLFVMGFALFQGGESTLTGDLYMVAAVLLCGLGYAEGARLSATRQLAGDLLGIGAFSAADADSQYHFPAGDIQRYTGTGLGGLIYVSLFSMLIGFSSGTAAGRRRYYRCQPVTAVTTVLGWCFPRGY